MSAAADSACDQIAQVALYALQLLPAGEAAAVQNHVTACTHCREELARLRPVVDMLAFWPTDVLRPSDALWDRLARRVAADSGGEPMPPAAASWMEPEWEQVASGVHCKVLSSDAEHDRVSMLVRLAPRCDYPSHRHAGVEELHLLHGELWIDGTKYHPGDYRRAEPGTRDSRVWSETGCTCLLITSTRDAIS